MGFQEGRQHPHRRGDIGTETHIETVPVRIGHRWHLQAGSQPLLLSVNAFEDW